MLTIEIEAAKTTGRWIAEVPDLAGRSGLWPAPVEEVIERVQVLSLRVLADRLEHGESRPGDGSYVRSDAMSRGPRPSPAASWRRCHCALAGRSSDNQDCTAPAPWSAWVGQNHAFAFDEDEEIDADAGVDRQGGRD